MKNHLMFGALLGAALALVGPLAGEGRGDFILRNDEQLTVNSVHIQGTLYDRSRASVVPGGTVTDYLRTYNSSKVDVSGGYVGYILAYETSAVHLSGGCVPTLNAFAASAVDIAVGGDVDRLDAFGTSTVHLTGGIVDTLLARDTSAVHLSSQCVRVGALTTLNSSTVHFTGGIVNTLSVQNTSAVDISGMSRVSWLGTFDTSMVHLSGGTVDRLDAFENSAVTFYGKDFFLGTGLSLDGERVLGTGILSGRWLGGTTWAVNITGNDSGATILLMPEPTTLALLALGGLLALRRRR